MTDPGADPRQFAFTHVEGEQGRLSFEGRDLGVVAGVELVGHFTVEGTGWLVVTDCDCPYEEMVYLTLLDTELRVIESCGLGGAFTAGIVEGIERLGPDRFHILFPSTEHGHMIAVEKRETGLFRKSVRWLHVMADA